MNHTDVDNEIIHLLFQTYRTMRRAMRFDTNLSEMTMVQMHVLMYINNKEDSTTSEIAHEFQISIPTTTVVLDKLEELEYLTRVHDDEDRRIVRIRLTKRGKLSLSIAKKERIAIMQRMLSRLEPREKNTFATILEKISTENKA